MPKQKTHKGLKKRVKVTASGKIVGKKAGKGHLLSCKSANRRRNLKKPLIIGGVGVKTLKEMLGKGA
ncbi:MAG: 50S ribosomal protein L35 [Phycisphaerae bacterium]|jgi:large subunit ribosomal protein L35|nr:MAG: 50S ribosomal protein L35 [Planctomycetes bacterium GWC2_45_44]HBG79085.1 50S ribosomal protein L35 [Phycisphaerales bacterium]HBR18913.1 50S ribosomal protein L35 [Phycisphaerales bacterium]